MKKLLVILMLGMFLISFASALEFDNVLKEKEITKDVSYFIGEKEIPYNKIWETYKPIEIVNAFGLGSTLYKDVLTQHSETCGYKDLCEDVWEVELTIESALLDDMKYKRQLEDGSWIDGKVRWNNFYYWGNVKDYKTECSPAKLTEKELLNGTKPYDVCIQVEDGSHEDWVQFGLGQKFSAGVYKVKSVAEKRPDWIIDYIPVVMGKELTSRAVWGAVIGVGGVEANITINSPANNSIQYTNSVTTSATANVTNGAHLTNASLNLSVNGGAWEIRNTTDLTTIGGDGLVSYYKLDETSGTTAIDSLIKNNLTNTNVLVNQVGKIDKAYQFAGSTNYIGSTTFANTFGYNKATSFSFWYYPTAFTNEKVIFSAGTDSSGDFLLRVNEKTAGGNKLIFEIVDDGTAVRGTATSTTAISNNNWYYVTAIYYANKSMELYVNGADRQTGTSTSTASTGNKIYFGAGLYNGNVNVDGFTGKLDEISIWNRTLTQTEITQLYNSGAGSRPITTTTTTFTNTFNVGDVVDFNYEFCDTDGDCGKSETRRFTIDSTAPTINLSYPTALIDYGKLNGTLQLNFTATDINLDKVWYNYNGTNVTIAGAVSGVYNISNITLSTKKNVTIYANDTAGNIRAEVFGWDYKVFENSQSYVNETYAKVSNVFVLNMTSVNATGAKLNYNGNNYTANMFQSGLNKIATISVTSPLIDNDTNITFYWIVSLPSEDIKLEEKNQTIRYIVVGNTYSQLIYNITVRNEETNAIIPNNNVTVSYEVTYGFDINSILGTVNFNDNKLANKNISSNIFTNLYLSGNIIYSSDLYIGRTLQFLENNISSAKNLTLYLSYSNSSFVKSILVTDEAGRNKPALFKQYRNINGIKTLVASEQLDGSGKSTIAFTPNVQYTFEFENTGCQNLTKNIIFYDQSDYVQVLSCSAYNPDDYLDPFENMRASFAPDGVFYVNNETEDDDSAFSVNVSGNSAFCNNINVISFSVFDELGNLIVNDNSNDCDVLGGSGFFDLYAVGNLYVLLDSGEEKRLSYRWIKIYSDASYSDYNIIELLKEVGNSDDILGIDWKFKLLISFIGLFGIIIAMTLYQRIYNFSNLPILIVANVYIWFMCFIGWGDINIGATGGGITALVSKYTLLILSMVASVGIIATKEDEYS